MPQTEQQQSLDQIIPPLKILSPIPLEDKRIYRNVVVVSRKTDWQLDDSSAMIIDADTYLKNNQFQNPGRYRIFNLCQSYDYCSKGYYVSLVAEARGHRPIPSVSTLLDMKSRAIVRVLGDDVQDQIQKILKPIRSKNFELSVYFGRNLSSKYEGLARILFSQFPSPLVRARFEKKNGEWSLKHIRPIPFRDIPETHNDFLFDSMKKFFNRRDSEKKKKTHKYEIAILVNPKEELPPSNAKAIEKFIKAGEGLRMYVDTIDARDISKLSTYDGLFIRETTDVGNHTFQYARRAEAEGLVVMDDPKSILHCCNKVYLHELLTNNNVPTPTTVIIDKNALDELPDGTQFPFVLKKPDSAFSVGVKKMENMEGFRRVARRYFDGTDLLLIQNFVPTDFDWRVGLIDGEPLFVCRYFMARNHWQIINHEKDGANHNGRVEAIAVEDAPRELLAVAKQAANLIGNGLYGVDIKQCGDKYLVIEVNDNPNIDCGYEDKILKDQLYLRVMQSFLARLEKR